MSIQVTCPAGHTLKVAADWAGCAGLCPICKAPIQVPGNREEVGRVERATGTATVATTSPASFNPTRPLAAPPVRTRTHTKPLPPAPPRLSAGAAQGISRGSRAACGDSSVATPIAAASTNGKRIIARCGGDRCRAGN